MIALTGVKDKRYGVMGLGKSGLSAVRALSASGALVTAWDDNPERRANAEEFGVSTQSPDQADAAGFEAIVWSPGVPHTFPQPHPLAEKAKVAEVALVCDLELLGQNQPEAVKVGVTGTNGKSTTTALLAHCLDAAGRHAQTGGNIGVPALDLDPLGAEGLYVLEMSSYQLELIPTLRFDLAIWLNVTPDHLDRHGGMDGYVAAKKNIFRGAPPPKAVIGVDDDHGKAVAAMVEGRGGHVLPVSTKDILADGVSMISGQLYDQGEAVFAMDQAPALPGVHNGQNAAAAYGALRLLGLGKDDITSGFQTFPGLPHRQERVAEINGVLYVNDSKATNAEASEKALSCYEHVYWIAGGQSKEGGIESLAPHFSRLRNAYLIGEAAPQFANTLKGKTAVTLSGDLSTAVTQAKAQAEADGLDGAVVLLSPACASWDQFASFEARGEAFKAAVKEAQA